MKLLQTIAFFSIACLALGGCSEDAEKKIVAFTQDMGTNTNTGCTASSGCPTGNVCVTGQCLPGQCYADVPCPQGLL